MRIKRNRNAVPVYRESGYAHRLTPVSRWEWWLRLAALACLVISVLLLVAARSNSSWVESYYSLGFYRIWAGAIATVTGLLPFSIAEWLLILFIVFCLVLLLRFAFQLVHYKTQWMQVLGRFAVRVVLMASAILMLFVLAGGLNYYRKSFVSYTNLTPHPATVSQLSELCQSLAEQANTLRGSIGEDKQGGAAYPQQSGWVLGATAPQSYRALIEQNPEWEQILQMATITRPKPVTFSSAMSYMQIVGVYFPYTVEANVNMHTTAYGIPGAMCHELAHVAGFMREDEANFIAYLACRASSDSFYRYSGTMLALVHSTNALYSVDRQAYHKVMSTLGEPVLRDLQLDATYWSRYDTPFGDFSTAVNDSYLKANDQQAGVASYGHMVDLLLADYMQQIL